MSLCLSLDQQGIHLFMKMGYEQILSLASKVNTIHNVGDLLREILISSMLLVEGEASSIFLINQEKTALEILDH